jgi:hypothetical protein
MFRDIEKGRGRRREEVNTVPEALLYDASLPLVRACVCASVAVRRSLSAGAGTPSGGAATRLFPGVCRWAHARQPSAWVR